MDAKTKRTSAERTRRAFTKAIAHLGFVRSKTSFWTRPNEHVVEFIHLHLFSFMPAFRVHFGIRVLNDSFEAPALNGLSSHDGWYGVNDRREYSFAFDESTHGQLTCADELARFCHNLGEPWFMRFREVSALLSPDASPLSAAAREALSRALIGNVESANVLASRTLLGVA